MDLENTIFLTFDIDWACDEILEDTIDIIESENVFATFFATHSTPLLGRLRNNNHFELGIHPNFNELLSGNNTLGFNEIIADLKLLVPEAVSVRSHSLVYSSHLLNEFLRQGLLFDLNIFIPEYSHINLLPYKDWNGMVRIPYFWEDDLYCINNNACEKQDWNVTRFLNNPGLKVFGFHPIHIFLNTENLQRYENTRKDHQHPQKLLSYRFCNEMIGTRVFLKNLITYAKSKAMNFGLIKEIEV